MYKDFQDRDVTRQNAWKFPGWDECVRRTGNGVVYIATAVAMVQALPPSSSPDSADGVCHPTAHDLLSFTINTILSTFLNFDISSGVLYKMHVLKIFLNTISSWVIEVVEGQIKANCRSICGQPAEQIWSFV